MKQTLIRPFCGRRIGVVRSALCKCKDMEAQVVDAETIPTPCIQVHFQLGSETYFTQANTGGLVSDQLVSIKERSMTILKDFITTHCIPHEVSSSSDDDQEDISATPPVKKSKKRQ